jgi:UDP-N-acetylglucosamine:LPS N-acetylglucosamine transferase
LFDKFETVVVTDNERATKKFTPLMKVRAIEYAMAFADRRKKLTASEATLTRWSYSLGYIKLFFQSLRIWNKYYPKVVVSTGSNMAVPFAIISLFHRSKFVFIETRARVYGKSVAGKIVTKLADKIIVQWPEMVDVYGGKAEYLGTLV